MFKLQDSDLPSVFLNSQPCLQARILNWVRYLSLNIFIDIVSISLTSSYSLLTYFPPFFPPKLYQMVNSNLRIHSVLINIPFVVIEILFSFEEFKFNFFSFLQLHRCRRAVSEISQLRRSRVWTSGCKICNKYMF